MPPELIYHYTGVAGLMGIIRERKLWATDVRFLNGGAEAGYGEQQLESILQAEIRSSHPPEVGLLRELLTQVQQSRSALRPFAACFSANRDHLGQWRRFGRLGYAMGFDPEVLTKLGYGTPSFSVVEMMYTEPDQRHAVLALIGLASEELVGARPHRALAPWLTATASSLCALAPSFKDFSFHEENELRAQVTWSEAESFPIEVRPGPLGPTPYVALDLSSEDNLALREIIVGPTDHHREVVQGVEDLLRNCGLSSIEAVGSQVPLRW